MGNPYDPVTVTNYNANPPSDDGAQNPNNRVTWASQKTKLADPIKDALEDIDANVSAAFGKTPGSAGLTSTALDYTVLAGDQGKTIVVTAPSKTITTPDATSVGAPFRFAVLNNSSGDATLDGNGSQTIDGVASVTIPSGAGMVVDTDGTNWLSEGQNFTRTQIVPQGYLTLTSATPVITGDVAAATTVYYTPDVGNLAPIPNGTKFNVREFAELSLALVSNHVASGIYDIFLFSDAGTLRIGTGPVWNTVTAGAGDRGTSAGTSELVRLKGLLTNKVSMTARNGSSTYSVAASCGLYLGSLFMDAAAGQVTCHRTAGQNRKWSVYNAFNQRDIELLVYDGTASWAYNTATIRQSNAATGNKATSFIGLADQSIDAEFVQTIRAATTGTFTSCLIGVNSTTAGTGRNGNSAAGSEATYVDGTAKAVVQPAIGIQNINCLEIGNGGNSTFYGASTSMLLAARWRG